MIKLNNIIYNNIFIKGTNLFETYYYYPTFKNQSIKQFNIKQYNLNKIFGLLETSNNTYKNNIYNLTTKSFNYKFIFNNLLNWFIFKNARYLYEIGFSPDYKSTLELILTLHTNIFTPQINNKTLTNYSVLQLQKLRNKRMQLIYIRRNATHNNHLLIISFKSILMLNLLVLKGIKVGVKGRAGDLRWVKLRYYSKNTIKCSKYSVNSIKSSNSLGYFVTKWGSTSIRCEMSSITYQTINSINV